MQGISFGLANLPYRSSNAQEAHGPKLHHHHHDRRIRDDVSPGGALANSLSRLSSSVRGLRNQLDALSTSAGLPDGLVSASGAQVVNKQRGELQIQTQEGDVVTLRFKARVSVAVDSLQFSTDNTSASATNAEVRSYSRVALSVEGDLNADELQAIEDLVSKVGDLTNEFFNGDMDNVLAEAMALSFDTSQLEGFSLDLRLKQSVSAYTYALPVVKPVASSAAEPDVSEPEVASTAEAAVAAADVPADTAEATTPEASAPVVSATEAAAAPDSVSTATQIVSDYVARVRASFSMQAGDASLGFSYEFKVRLLMSSIEQSAPVESAPDEAGLAYLEQQLTDSAV